MKPVPVAMIFHSCVICLLEQSPGRTRLGYCFLLSDISAQQDSRVPSKALRRGSGYLTCWPGSLSYYGAAGVLQAQLCASFLCIVLDRH